MFAKRGKKSAKETMNAIGVVLIIATATAVVAQQDASVTDLVTFEADASGSVLISGANDVIVAVDGKKFALKQLIVTLVQKLGGTVDENGGGVLTAKIGNSALDSAAVDSRTIADASIVGADIKSKAVARTHFDDDLGNTLIWSGGNINQNAFSFGSKFNTDCQYRFTANTDAGQSPPHTIFYATAVNERYASVLHDKTGVVGTIKVNRLDQLVWNTPVASETSSTAQSIWIVFNYQAVGCLPHFK
jgi:hypothetical protein